MPPFSSQLSCNNSIKVLETLNASHSRARAMLSPPPSSRPARLSSPGELARTAHSLETKNFDNYI